MFTIGQQVRVTSGAYTGDTGTVVQYDEGDWFPYGVRIELADGTDGVCFMASELENVNESF